MKKLFLFSLFLLSFVPYLNAQVIEIVGKGVLGKTDPNISFTDLKSIQQVDVEAIYKCCNYPETGIPAESDDVKFYDSDEGPLSSLRTDIIYKDAGTTHQVFNGYFGATFNTFDNNGINAMIKNAGAVMSLYAYVYRNDLTSEFYSVLGPESMVYFYRNGKSDPHTVIVDIEQADSFRDIIVKVPISDLSDDNRNFIVDISAGPIKKVFEEFKFDEALGEALVIREYKLENVPGNVNQIKISFYSPVKTEVGGGDSAFISRVVVDIEKEFTGCTLTQGYWKNHSICKAGKGKGPKRDDTWDLVPGGQKENSEFFLSNQDYCEVFDTKPGKGGKYYILAHQYIAAQLNLLANADPNDISDSFKEATDFLEVYTPKQVKGNKSLEAKAVELGGILDDFNNGKIGPGHCDDNNDQEEDEVYIEPVKQERSKTLVYPNPANDIGKIAFVSKQTSFYSVELFNIHGQKIGTFFEGKIKKGDQINIEYDASRLPKGIYFALIKNGTDIYKEKISITR